MILICDQLPNKYGLQGLLFSCTPWPIQIPHPSFCKSGNLTSHGHAFLQTNTLKFQFFNDQIQIFYCIVFSADVFVRVARPRATNKKATRETKKTQNWDIGVKILRFWGKLCSDLFRVLFGLEYLAWSGCCNRTEEIHIHSLKCICNLIIVTFIVFMEGLKNHTYCESENRDQNKEEFHCQTNIQIYVESWKSRFV